MVVLPPDIQQVVDSERNRIKSLSQDSQERQSSETWVDCLERFPWTRSAAPAFDLQALTGALKRSHWGLNEAKRHLVERLVLEHVTCKKQPTVMCFAGPPGTGKTTVAMAMAEAAGRPCKVLSLNGITDVAELKGHRRTYIGAQSGRLVRALLEAQVNNPVIVLDEVDKCIGNSSVANALLDILDPNLQRIFYDNYLTVPIDLRPVTFICTVNDLQILPEPLRDRMHTIRFRSYTEPERKTIAKYYAWPQILESSGLLEKGYDVQIEDHVIDQLSREHESVRQIRSMMEALLRSQLYESYVSNSRKVTIGHAGEFSRPCVRKPLGFSR